MAVCTSSSHSEPDNVAEVSGLRSNKYDAIVCQIAAEAGDLRYGFAAALLY